MPIRLHGQIIGNLKLSRTEEKRPWAEDELAITQATAERVALAIENARLLEDAQRRAIQGTHHRRSHLQNRPIHQSAQRIANRGGGTGPRYPRARMSLSNFKATAKKVDHDN